MFLLQNESRGDGQMRRNKLLVMAIGFVFLLQPLNAQTWETAKRLTWTSSSSLRPNVATDSGNNIHVVWWDYFTSTPDIFHKKSTDGGTTWITKRLTWNPSHSFYSRFAIDSTDNIHVVWQDNAPGNLEIYYKKSTNGGTTWSKNKRLTWNSGGSENPYIATDSSGTIHVIWDDISPGNRELYYRKSTNGGTTWSGRRLTWNSGSSISANIAIDQSGNIHVVWNDYTPGNYEIYHKKSTNSGTTWSKNKRLTWNSGNSRYPIVATDSSDNIHVVWKDNIHGNDEIFYKKSTNGGASWVTKKLTWNSGDSDFPVIATDSNDYIHVVWEDDTPGDLEIHYKRSTNGGTTWTEKRLTWLSGISYRPKIAIDSIGNIHVVWSDKFPGNQEIYYKKGIQ
jgi:hypothetical protein